MPSTGTGISGAYSCRPVAVITRALLEKVRTVSGELVGTKDRVEDVATAIRLLPLDNDFPLGQIHRTAAPTPNPDGSAPAGSLDGAKGSKSSGWLVVRLFAERSRAGAEDRAVEENVMTVNKDVKRLIRERQAKTGESYTTARMHVLGERVERVAPLATPTRHEAVVLKVNKQSARLRILGAEEQVTFRSASGDVYRIVPGHVVDITVDKRWLWLGADYASGTIASARIDVAKLGLEQLPLEGGELEDIREYSDPCEKDDPYAPIWNALTAEPRPAHEFDGIAWGNLPGGGDPDDNPTCQVAELREMGRDDEAHALLMDALATDLRCLDAHAHLGNALFDREPGRAIAHYEIGMRIGELSLPFNPDDHQGARFCLYDVRERRSWEEINPREG